MFLGAHTDKKSITKDKEIRRWPVLSIQKILEHNEVKIRYVEFYLGAIILRRKNLKNLV